MSKTPTPLDRIEKELDEARVPREVFIGADSTADRVTWLIKRRELLERRASTRFETFDVEFGILSCLPAEWLTPDEIRARIGYGDPERVKSSLEYLYSRGLIAACNDGLRGNLYASLEIWQDSVETTYQLSAGKECSGDYGNCEVHGYH